MSIFVSFCSSTSRVIFVCFSKLYFKIKSTFICLTPFKRCFTSSTASSWKPYVYADSCQYFCTVLSPSCGLMWVTQALHNSLLLLVQNVTVPESTNGTSRTIFCMHSCPALLFFPIQTGVHAHTHSVMPSAACVTRRFILNKTGIFCCPRSIEDGTERGIKVGDIFNPF